MKHHKAYRPREVSPSAIMAVLLKSQLIEPLLCDAKESELDAALAALLAGKATAYTMDVLIDAANIGGERMRYGDFEEGAYHVISAKHALETIKERQTKTGKLGCSLPEHRAIDDYIPVYIAMMRTSTHQEMRAASKPIMAAQMRMEKAA